MLRARVSVHLAQRRKWASQGVTLSDESDELDDFMESTVICDHCKGMRTIEDPDNPGEIIDDPVCEGNGFIQAWRFAGMKSAPASVLAGVPYF
jgi:hypothetical protein